jgi:hypothetical protein
MSDTSATWSRKSSSSVGRDELLQVLDARFGFGRALRLELAQIARAI